MSSTNISIYIIYICFAVQLVGCLLGSITKQFQQSINREIRWLCGSSGGGGVFL